MPFYIFNWSRKLFLYFRHTFNDWRLLIPGFVRSRVYKNTYKFFPIYDKLDLSTYFSMSCRRSMLFVVFFIVNYSLLLKFAVFALGLLGLVTMTLWRYRLWRHNVYTSLTFVNNVLYGVLDFSRRFHDSFQWNLFL